MPANPPHPIRRLRRQDLQAVRQLNALFAEAFADFESYAAHPPSDAYVQKLLDREDMFFLVAESDATVVGGLVAYQLQKFESERSEIYIYDLAIQEAHRRRGIATALIERLRDLARECGAWTIYVQADYPDAPAIALYEKLGEREEVLHFDILVQEAR